MHVSMPPPHPAFRNRKSIVVHMWESLGVSLPSYNIHHSDSAVVNPLISTQWWTGIWTLSEINLMGHHGSINVLSSLLICRNTCRRTARRWLYHVLMDVGKGASEEMYVAMSTNLYWTYQLQEASINWPGPRYVTEWPNSMYTLEYASACLW